MADHHQLLSSEAAAAYTPKQIEDTKAFIDEMLVDLAASPDVQHEFVRLLSGFVSRADDDAVVSRAVELLGDHHDVLRRFTLFIYVDVPPSAEQILSLTTRTRRRTSRRRSERRGTLKQQTPAAHVVAAAARNDGNDDGRPRRSADAALAFIKRVHDTAGPVIHARFLDVLSEAKGGEDMFADEIYDRAKRAFGPAHVSLLHTFATVWLPGAQEWKLQQQARGPAARQLSRVAAGMPGAKKRRADDDGNAARRHDTDALGPQRQRNRVAVASSHAVADAKKPRAHVADNGRRHDHVIAVLEVRNVKKRRNDDDGLGCDYAARSRAKKPHIGPIGIGEFSGSSATTARVLGDVATGVRHAYSDDNDKKPPRRRAANGGEDSSAGAAAGPERKRDDEVRRFRQEWEFQTWYSKLVATSDRVTELLRPTRTPHGDGGGNGNRSLVALFPLPECREFLHNFYGDCWGKMSAALERGESLVPALEAIERRLTAKEEEAVVEESRKRRRHDPARVAQRLRGLSMDYVTLEEECGRGHHGGCA